MKKIFLELSPDKYIIGQIQDPKERRNILIEKLKLYVVVVVHLFVTQNKKT